VVLGGTALLGGEGGVVGSVIAVFVLATLDNIFTQLSIDPYVIEVVRGSIMIVAVVAYGLRLRKRAQA
jgi:ribose transport system permease protein